MNIYIIRFVTLILMFFCFFSKDLQANSPDSIWLENKYSKDLSASLDKKQHFVYFNKDSFNMKSSGISSEKSLEIKVPDLKIYLPSPNGTYKLYSIIDSPVMAPELAAKYPEIKTYRGVGVDDPAAKLRMDVSPLGCHVQVRSASGTFYIDPHKKGLHAVRSREVIKSKDHDFICKTDSSSSKKILNNTLPSARTSARTTSGSVLRTFRLAVAATGEYTVYHGGTKALSLAAIVSAINRVNQIYENDFAVRLILIANNDQIIYTDAATDPYSSGDTAPLLVENQGNIDNVIGNGNYDIGHVFSTISGGIAGLGVVCAETLTDPFFGVILNGKAFGVTGRANPTGDAFWIDYVAHEIGHQFSAEHCFNGENGACGNRVAWSAYEPGSGSTIMSYAGICDGDDLQLNSDAFFHARSLEQVSGFLDYISCGASSNTLNNPPVANAGPDYVIPKQTPFELTADASDIDGDMLTYSWEQWDLGESQAISEMVNTDNGASPIFRCWLPTNSPVRIFPRLQDLLANTNSVGERYPETAREMRFRLVVRDNNSGGGGVDTDDIIVTVDAGSGPFSVTAPNTTLVWSNSTQTVTWAVANTTNSTINCSNVNILLSIDGGITWPFTLAAATENDGSETIIIPDVDTSSARIKVAGYNNIFFDVSDQDFTISRPVSTNGTLGFKKINSYVNENVGSVNIEVIRSAGSSGAVSINYASENGEAKNGKHYQAVSGSLSFSDGQLTNSFNINIKNNVDAFEGQLDFKLVLSSPSGAALGFPYEHTVYINEVNNPILATASNCNNSSITINDMVYNPFDPVSGAATPYPSTITVSGLQGEIYNMTVELNGFGHSYPSDVDIWLVGPGRETIPLMSDVGDAGGGLSSVSGLNLKFSDAAASFMPESSTLTSGTWKPTEYNYESDIFPDPIPPTPMGTKLSVFNGTSPNGIWKLYISDDTSGDSGQITGGWCLNFELPLVMKIKDVITEAGNDNVNIKFNSTFSGSYEILKSENIISGEWVTNQTFEMQEAGATTLTDTNGLLGVTQAFYRIQHELSTE